MANLEKIKPWVVNGKIVESAYDRIAFVEEKSGRETVFSRKSKIYLTLFCAGKSIQEIVLELCQKGMGVQFIRIHRVLEKLYLSGLIVNDHEFFGKFRSRKLNLGWGYPFLRNPFWSSPSIGQTKVSTPRPTLALILALLFIVSSFLQIPSYLSLDIGQHLFFRNGNYWMFYPIVFFWSSVLRSIKNIIRGYLIRTSSGGFPLWRIRIDALSLYVDLDDDAMLRVNEDRLGWLIFIASSLSYFCLPFLIKLTGLSGELITEIRILCLSWFLLEFTPYSKGDFITLLHVLFSRRSGSRTEDMPVDRPNLYYFHSIMKWIWPLVVAIPLTMALAGVFSILKQAYLEQLPQVLYSGILMTIIITLVLVSIFDEIYFTYVQIDDQVAWHRVVDYFHAERSSAHSKDKLIDHDTIEGYLASIPLFINMPAEVLKGMAKYASIRKLGPGAYICHQGQVSNELYIVLLGSVAVYHKRKGGKQKFLIRLERDSVFGEMGFFLEQPRTADVVTMEESFVLRIRKESKAVLNYLKSQRFSKVLRDRVWLYQTLASTDIFQDLPSELLGLFIGRGHIIDFTPGQTLIEEGAAGADFYLIVQGQMEITKRAISVGTLSNGEFFGEIALLKGLPRIATVRCLVPSKVLCLTAEDFWQILSENLSLGLYIEEVANQRMKNLR